MKRKSLADRIRGRNNVSSEASLESTRVQHSKATSIKRSPCPGAREVSATTGTANILTCWEEASDKLRTLEPDTHAKLTLAIRAHSQSEKAADIEGSISAVLSNNIALMIDRQWAIKWGQRKFHMREVIDKVVRSLEKFKDVGSVAASLDPLHAGIAWAGICILLPLVLNLKAQENAANLGIGQVAQWIAQCAAIEEAQPLYGRAVPKLDDFQGLIKDLEAKQTTCYQLLQMKQNQEVRDRVNAILDRFEDRDRTNIEILQWLCKVQYGNDHDAIQQKLDIYARSGRWFFTSDDYRTWSSGVGQRVLCLQAHIGTGKTSLVSMVIQQILENLKPSVYERIAYFYCIKKDHDPPTSLMILRCFVVQLAWLSDGTTISEEVRAIYSHSKRISGSGCPGVKECTDLLDRLIANVPCVTLVVDALDECSDPWVLLGAMQQLIENATSSVKILLSCRMHVDVLEWFPYCRRPGIAGNQDDVRHYIQTEMSLNSKRFLKGQYLELEHRITSVLTQRAENVFRWAELTLELFLSRKSPIKHPHDARSKLDEIEAEIGSGQPGLNAAYAETYAMNTEQPYVRHLVEKILKWLLLPACQLSPEFHHVSLVAGNVTSVTATVQAISLNADGDTDPLVTPEYILDICSNFVLVDPFSGSFKLAHLSVREYLLSRATIPTELPHYTAAEIATVAVTCSLARITKYSRRSAKVWSSALQPVITITDFDLPLTQFAAYWPAYYHSFPSVRADHTVDRLLKNTILTRLEAFETWIEVFLNHNCLLHKRNTPHSRCSCPGKASCAVINEDELFVRGNPSRAFVAVVFGLEEIIRLLPRDELRERNDRGMSCVDVARGWRRDEIERVLVQELGLEVY